MHYFDTQEELQVPKPYQKDGEFDMNDQLQAMQDTSCYNLFKKRHKKCKKYNEWKKDMLRDNDTQQMDFLTQQIQRLRKKEEFTVTKRAQPRKSQIYNQLSVTSTKNTSDLGGQQPNSGSNIKPVSSFLKSENCSVERPANPPASDQNQQSNQ